MHDPHEHVDEGAGVDEHVGLAGVAGHCLGHQRLAGAWRTHQQHASRHFSTQRSKMFRAFQEFDQFGGFPLGGLLPGDIVEEMDRAYMRNLLPEIGTIYAELNTLLEEAGLGAAGDLADKWVYVEGADASSNGRSIPMEKALDDVLVAFKANGEALRKEHGYPVRLVVPGWEGNMWVKWLRRIEVTAQAIESREETSKYTDTLADGTSRKWTWVMDAKSVITSPSPQAPITHGHGPLVITGLAWSGRGAITGVDVSLDGGKN